MNLASLINLKLNTSKSKDLVVTYKGESLCLIKTSVLEKFLVDFTSNGRIAALLKSTHVNSETSETAVDKAIKLYFTRKKAFYTGRPLAITTIKKSSPDYVKFKQAVAIADSHGVNFSLYLKAQEEELKHFNHGNGTYPSPSHLCTANAENRLIEYLGKSKHKAIITEYDKTAKYKDNKKFTSIYDKVKASNLKEVSLIDIDYLTRVIESKEDELPEVIKQAKIQIMEREENGN